MDEIADGRPRLGAGELTAVGDAFPALLPNRETVAERERVPASARPAIPMAEASHAPPRSPTSIPQAERQAKIVVVAAAAALAALAYFFHIAF
jgi:hypothetical protein